MFNTPEGNRILRYGSIVLVILGIFLAAQVIYTLISAAHVDDSASGKNVITVNGRGEIIAIPDIAMFSFGAEQTSATVAEAQQKVTEKINQAIGLLKNAGIEDKDIRTVAYNINPHYVYNTRPCTQFSCPPSEPRIDGYDVGQTIEVKVRDIAKAGTVLGNLGELGVSNVSGLTFVIDEQEKVQAEARKKAVEDARKQAEELADSLDARLGKIVSFNEGYFPEPYYAREGFGKGGDAAMNVQAAPSPEVPTGQNTVVSNVSITYEIK